MPSNRSEARRAYDQAYREAHRDEARAYRLAHLAEERERHRRYYEAHRESDKAKNQARYQRNRERLCERQRQRYQRNKVRINARQRAYDAAHADQVRAAKRAYAQAHREAIKAQKRQYAEIHRARIRAYKRLYRQQHPEVGREAALRRQARLRGAAVIDLTRAEWETIKTAYAGRCAYCSRKPARLEKDHITPVSDGGSHTLSNIVPACRTCNRSKGTGQPLRPVQPLLLA